MAKIPLRAYIKEIENLIERGEIEPAIAHAKNILRAYPKSIETYRLLGKAYLESQRYGEAGDILQRVLSVVPDDFVSQIGMSIIREDEGNMDAAIWHMERAYEVQPFNPAVQDELRRLYGRRDGVEPPKIRLTRGALVRMYTRGELYPQAIAETRAALAEDPQRYDLRVLLARLYFETGQTNDAAEVCSELLTKLPYCYEANKLLSEILPKTSRDEETSKFQQRIFALNPYEAFVSPSAPTSTQVPDQAVMVEQTIWDPDSELEKSPDWARTLGATWEESEPEEQLPDWLNTIKPEVEEPELPEVTNAISDQPTSFDLDTSQTVSPPAEFLADQSEEESLVPDWMKDAGWAASERSADEIMAEQMESSAEDEIQPAEIPDWLQSMAPPEAQMQPQGESERTEWLDSLLAPEESSQETASERTPSSLDEPLEEFSFEAPEIENEVPAPDWLSGLETAEQAPEIAGLPDWLAQMQEEQAQEPASSAVGENIEITEPVQFTETSLEETLSPSEESLPDWLKSFETETAQAAVEPAQDVQDAEESAVTAEGMSFDELPESVSEMPAGEPATESVEETNLPDWLLALEEDEVVETKGLEEIRADLSTDEAEIELPSVAAAAFDLSADEALEAELPAMVESAEFIPEEAVEPSAVVESTLETAPDFSDTDATMAWLEALAARQGADEATLITPPEQRSDTLPDWLQAETEAVETVQDASAASELAEAAGVSEHMDSAAGTVSTDLEETIEAAMPQETELEALETTEETGLPDWLIEENLAAGDELESEVVEAQEEQPAIVMPELSGIEELPEGLVETELPEAEVTMPEVSEIETTRGHLLEEEGILPIAEMEQADEEIAQPLEVISEVDTEFVSGQESAAEMALPDLSNMDDAMAWLESLAARQGADEATLITPVEDRTDTPPDWVSEIKEEVQLPEAAAVDQVVSLETTEPSPEDLDENDLPDWLKGAEERPLRSEAEPMFQVEDIESHLEETTETAPHHFVDLVRKEAPAETGQPEAVDMEWLKTLEGEQVPGNRAEESIIWTDDLEVEAEVEAEIPEWLSAEIDKSTAQQPQEAAGSAELPEWLAGLETEDEQLAPESALPASDEIHTAWEPEEISITLDDQAQEAAVETPTALPDLQSALNEGQLETALEGYNRLIQNDENLEDVIRDLRDALYRYPVDVSLWTALGDAYMHSDQVQEALDAYTKAEELLR